MCSCKYIYVHAFGYETFIVNMRYMHIFLKLKSSLYTYCSCYLLFQVGLVIIMSAADLTCMKRTDTYM